MNDTALNIQRFNPHNALKTDSVTCFVIDHDTLSELENPTFTVNSYVMSIVLIGDLDFSSCGRINHLTDNHIMVTPPLTPINYIKCTRDYHAEVIAVSPDYFESILRADDQLFQNTMLDKMYSENIFEGDETKTAMMHDLYRQIERSIRKPHLYKDAMLNHFIHVAQLFIAEMMEERDRMANVQHNDFGTPASTLHDFRHAENIFRIFTHLARQHFRTERQIKFYADKLNISSAYLSRTVKNVSGNTVYSYIQHLLFDEIKRLLTNSDLTISEIAFQLEFKDQSALTNFFKLKSGLSPVAFRKAHSQTPL